MAGCHAQYQEAPGGSPGTPGVNIIPLAMLMRPDAATVPCTETGLRRHAESPSFRRGLLPDTMSCFLWGIPALPGLPVFPTIPPPFRAQEPRHVDPLLRHH